MRLPGPQTFCGSEIHGSASTHLCRILITTVVLPGVGARRADMDNRVLPVPPAGYGALAGDGAAGAFTIEIIVVETSDAKSPAANAKEESVDKK